MMYFRPITHLETFPVIARLHRLSLEFGPSGILWLAPDSETYLEWKSLQGLLRNARKQVGPKIGEVGNVRLERLLPDQNSGFERDLPNEWLTFRLPLVTNPLVLNYCRQESVHMAVGSLWWTDTEQMHGAANWGTEPAYQLAFDLHKPEPDVPV